MPPIFTHPDGTLNPYPHTRADALALSSTRYDDHEPCPRCITEHGTRTSIKYAQSGACVHCSRLDALELYNDILKNGMLPTSAQADSELWVTYLPCEKAGHLGVKMLNGRCWQCEQDRRNRPPSPRQAAKRAGETWYTPDTLCPHCGTKALKRVNNGECQGCRG